MTLRHHRLLWSLALAAVTAAIITLAWSAKVAQAADFQEAKGNVCEGNLTPAWCAWTGVTGEDDIALGDEMMPLLTSGVWNVALDHGALAANTTGSGNVAIGADALFSNTIGGSNIASGAEALYHNTTGFHNIASGYEALFSNTTGSFNIASGAEALFFNTEGNNNIASGHLALQSNMTGSFGVADGFQALRNNTTGLGNVASGANALYLNTTGTNNVAMGYEALPGNETGSHNVAFGDGAGRNVTGSSNIDISNEGLATDSGTTRIGTEGTQTKTFVSGIYPVSPPNGSKTCTVKVTEKGQLVCSGSSALKRPEDMCAGKSGREHQASAVQKKLHRKGSR